METERECNGKRTGDTAICCSLSLVKALWLKSLCHCWGRGGWGGEGSERQRKIRRERKRQCQGLIAPVGVMVRQLSWRVGGGDTGAHSFFYSFYACFCKRLSIDSCSFSSPYLHPAVNRFPEGYSGFWVKALGLLSYWLSGSVEDSRTEQGKDSGKTNRKKWEVDLARSSALIPRCVFFANVCSL